MGSQTTDGFIRTLEPYGSPLKLLGFISHDMVACRDVKHGKVTRSTLHMHLSDIQGGLDAVMELLPEGTTRPDDPISSGGRNWIMPKLKKNNLPKLTIDIKELPDLEGDDLDLGI